MKHGSNCGCSVLWREEYQQELGYGAPDGQGTWLGFNRRSSQATFSSHVLPVWVVWPPWRGRGCTWVPGSRSRAWGWGREPPPPPSRRLASGIMTKSIILPHPTSCFPLSPEVATNQILFYQHVTRARGREAGQIVLVAQSMGQEPPKPHASWI